MRRIFTSFCALCLIGNASLALAEDAAKPAEAPTPATPTSAAPAPAKPAAPAAESKPATAPVATPAAPAPAAPAPATSATPAESNSTPTPSAQMVDELTKPQELKAISAELMDGTQVIFNPDGTVEVVGIDNKKRTPPDGVLTLRDGTTFAVEKGFRVEE